METKKKWIKKSINPAEKGSLHKALNVSLDKKITEKKLSKATHSKNPTLKKKAIWADTVKSFKKP